MRSLLTVLLGHRALAMPCYSDVLAIPVCMRTCTCERERARVCCDMPVADDVAALLAWHVRRRPQRHVVLRLRGPLDGPVDTFECSVR